jgi:hypothetical protein
MKRSREGASDGVDDLTGGLPVYYDFVQATLSDDVVSAPIATSPRKAVKPRGSRKVASVSAPRESLEQLGASAASSVSEVPALSSSASSRADKLDLSEDIPTAKMPASAPGGMHAFAREHWDGLIKTGLAKIAIPSAAVRAQEECGPEIIKDILERVLGKSYKMNTYVCASVVSCARARARDRESMVHYKLTPEFPSPFSAPSLISLRHFQSMRGRLLQIQVLKVASIFHSVSVCCAGGKKCKSIPFQRSPY